jgi:hypothetical protein
MIFKVKVCPFLTFLPAANLLVVKLLRSQMHSFVPSVM